MGDLGVSNGPERAIEEVVATSPFDFDLADWKAVEHHLLCLPWPFKLGLAVPGFREEVAAYLTWRLALEAPEKPEKWNPVHDVIKALDSMGLRDKIRLLALKDPSIYRWADWLVVNRVCPELTVTYRLCPVGDPKRRNLAKQIQERLHFAYSLIVFREPYEINQRKPRRKME